tara:strand:- start:16150 stop:17121 length:972 start_codon:yes stop_codon:yes gene_type:complete
MKFEKLLIIGPGSIGQKHIQAAKKINVSLEIGVLRSRKKINIDTNNSNNSNWKEFKSIKEIFKWNPDLIIISTPANMHLEQVKEIISLNKPILIEKPVGSVNDPLIDWLDINNKNEAHIQVGYQLRFDPCYSILKETIARNSLGKVIFSQFFCGSWLPDWRNKNYKDTVSVSKHLGGGVVAELSHELDLCLSLLGPIDLKWCYKGNSGLLDIQCEDNLHLVAESSKSLKVIIDLDFCSFSSRRFVMIRGTKGEIFWDILKGKLSRFDINGEHCLFNKISNNEDKLINQIKDIINYKNINSIGCTLPEGISVLGLIKKIDNYCL